MGEVSIKVHYKFGASFLEIEISGEKEDVDFFLEKLLGKFESIQQSSKVNEVSMKEAGKEAQAPTISAPAIKISKSDSLSDILNKLFMSGWGRTPRSLREVIESLETLGVYYPKSTIAVTLKRLVEKGTLRRIKGKDGVFRYVVSTPSIGES